RRSRRTACPAHRACGAPRPTRLRHVGTTTRRHPRRNRAAGPAHRRTRPGVTRTSRALAHRRARRMSGRSYPIALVAAGAVTATMAATVALLAWLALMGGAGAHGSCGPETRDGPEQ